MDFGCIKMTARIFLIGLMCGLVGCQTSIQQNFVTPKHQEMALDEQMIKNTKIVSYYFGYMHAESVANIKDEQERQAYIDMMLERGVASNRDRRAYAQGIQDRVMGKSMAYSEQMFLKANDELQIQQANQKRREGEFNRKIGENFLANNAKDPNIKTTPSGLQYKIIKQGTGKILGDEVVVHYQVSTIDGLVLWGKPYGRQVIENTQEIGEQTLRLSECCYQSFWREGLAQIGQGGIIELYVPNHQNGYGDTPYYPNLPAGMTLVYRIEVMDR